MCEREVVRCPRQVDATRVQALERPAELLGGGGPDRSIDLTPLGEVQGEAVALLDNGAVILTSEGGFPGAAGTVAVLSCELTPPGSPGSAPG